METILIILVSILAVISIVLLLAVLLMAKKTSEMGARIDDSRKDIEGTRRDIEETRRDIQDSNRQVADALDKNSSQLSDALNKNSMQMDQRMENLRTAVDKQLSNIRDDNTAQLEKMRQTVDEKLQSTLEKRLSESFDSVRKSLDSVYSGIGEMKSLAGDVSDLKKVMSNVKTRGILGEYQLGAIIGEILTPEQYDTNVATVPESSERVEFAVKMPGDGSDTVYLPIDAKFPGDRYQQLLDAYDSGDKETVEEARKNLAIRIRQEAKDVHEKYIKPPFTTEFGVIFLPFEGLYAEVVNMGLVETLQQEYRIMISGPSTISALLNSLQMGFKALAIQKNAGEVWKVLNKVKNEFGNFEGILAKTQKNLNAANNNLEQLMGVRTRAIQRSLKEVESHTLGEDEDFGFEELEEVKEIE